MSAEDEKVRLAANAAISAMRARRLAEDDKAEAYEAMRYALRLLEAMSATTQACSGYLEPALVEAICRKALLKVEEEPF